MKLSFDKKLVLFFSIIFMGVVAAGIATYKNNQAVQDTDALVQHTRKVLYEAGQVFSATQDIVLKSRGYLITGDSSFLQDYTKTDKVINIRIATLENLIGDNAAQRLRVDSVKKMIAERISFSDLSIHAYREGGFEQARLLVASGKGKLYLDEIRNLIQEVEHEENELLKKREEANLISIAAYNRSFYMLIGGALLLLVFAFFFVRHNLVERGKVEEALKKSLEEISDFKSLFESAPGLFLILLPDLIIDAVSDEYLDATMTKRNEIIGRHLFEVFPDNPDDPKADGVSNLRASLNTVLKTKAVHAMALQKYDIRRPDGIYEERYWSPLNKPVLNAKGEVVYIIHSAVDVTERIRHEKEILRATTEIKDLYDNAPCGYFSVDSEILVANINRTLLHWLGYTDKEVIGQMKFEDFLSAQSREQHLTIFKETLKNGQVNDLEYEFKRKDGTVFPALVNSTTMVDEHGVFVKSRSTVFDNTTRKRAEETIQMLNKELVTNLNQLESVNKELESFSYSVSHDLRAPLRGIHGYTQMLMEDYGSLFDAEANRLMRNITGNAKKMGQLIDDLLTFSRLGRKELVRTNMFMHEAVIAICEELKREHSERVIQYKIGNLHPAKADSVIMKQVWVNLISNALKYSKLKEHSIIEIGSEEKGDEIIYYIKDNGAGFDMRYADKLFGVFQRLHSDKEFEGTGVGLAIVQRIVAKHGGRVWAEGKVNEGATFYFTLNKS